MEYYARLFVVVSALTTGTLVLAAVLLTPAYFRLTSELATGRAMTGPQTTTEGVLREDASATLLKASRELRELERVLNESRTSDILSEVLEERPEGISVTALAFDRSQRSVSLEGVSKTRDALFTYAQKLEQNPNFGNVPRPISDLAKNADLEFRLSFNIEDTPQSTQP